MTVRELLAKQNEQQMEEISNKVEKVAWIETGAGLTAIGYFIMYPGMNLVQKYICLGALAALASHVAMFVGFLFYQSVFAKKEGD